MLLLFSGAGLVGRTGTLTKTLGALTIDAQGVVGSAPIQGTLTKTLGSLSVVAAGTVAIQGVLTTTLGALALLGTGTVVDSGTPGFSETASVVIQL